LDFKKSEMESIPHKASRDEGLKLGGKQCWKETTGLIYFDILQLTKMWYFVTSEGDQMLVLCYT